MVKVYAKKVRNNNLQINSTTLLIGEFGLKSRILRGIMEETSKRKSFGRRKTMLD